MFISLFCFLVLFFFFFFCWFLLGVFCFFVWSYFRLSDFSVVQVSDVNPFGLPMVLDWTIFVGQLALLDFSSCLSFFVCGCRCLV